MSPAVAAARTDIVPQRDAFLKWQCRVRQFAARQFQGKPDSAVSPAVALPGRREPIGTIITVLNKSPGYSVIPELRHIAARTHDLAERRSRALQFLSAGYFQRHREFSDILTATFSPDSLIAARIKAAGCCRLLFDAYNQRFNLSCHVRQLAREHPLSVATLAHNRLFNPILPPGTEILGFEPEWSASTANPGTI